MLASLVTAVAQSAPLVCQKVRLDSGIRVSIVGDDVQSLTAKIHFIGPVRVPEQTVSLELGPEAHSLVYQDQATHGRDFQLSFSETDFAHGELNYQGTNYGKLDCKP